MSGKYVKIHLRVTPDQYKQIKNSAKLQGKKIATLVQDRMYELIEKVKRGEQDEDTKMIDDRISKILETEVKEFEKRIKSEIIDIGMNCFTNLDLFIEVLRVFGIRDIEEILQWSEKRALASMRTKENLDFED